MNRRLRWIVPTVCAIVLAPPAWSQVGAERVPGLPRGAQPDAGRTAASHDVRLGALIGATVQDASGGSAGRVDDFVVDLNNERALYVVVAPRGHDARRVLYPFTAVRVAPGGQALRLQARGNPLDRAPGFDAERWPDLNRAGYRDEIERVLGTLQDAADRDARRGAAAPPPAGADSPGSPRRWPPAQPRPQRLERASRLLDDDVRDKEGRDIGDVEDLVADIGTGQIRYSVVKFDPAWTPGERLVVLPLHAYTRNDRQELRIDLPREALAGAPSFAPDAWPNLDDPRYRAAIERWLTSVPVRDATNARSNQG